MSERVTRALVAALLVGVMGWSAPRLEVSEDRFDFGEVQDGTVVRHTFTLANTGDEPLAVSRVAYNCGCTSYDLPKRELQPGESAELTVRFNTTGYGSRSQPVSQSLIVHSNDPEGARELVLTGRVVPAPTVPATDESSVVVTTTAPLPGVGTSAPSEGSKPTLVNLQVDLVTPEDAEAVLPLRELIESYGWYTTVYVTGEIALAYPNLVKEIHDRGHQIGVLGWEAGEDLLSFPEEELYDRLDNAFLAVRAAVGDMRPAYIADFKPQGYRVNEALLRVLSRLEVRSCTAMFPDGPEHPHHIGEGHGGLVAIPLARSVQSGQVLADDVYILAGKSVEEFFADLCSRYDTNRLGFKPSAATVRPALVVSERMLDEALRAFLGHLARTFGQLTVVDQLTVQANPFIDWIKIEVPDVARAGEEITITVRYYANCDCPRYYFRVYGCEHGWKCDLPLVRKFYWSPLGEKWRYPPGAGEDKFTLTISPPVKPGGYTYRLVVVGQACHGGPCWPSYAESVRPVYDALARTQVQVESPLELLSGDPEDNQRYPLTFVPFNFRGDFAAFRKAAVADWEALKKSDPFKDYVDRFNVWAVYREGDEHLGCSKSFEIKVWCLLGHCLTEKYWTCDNKAAAKKLASVVPNVGSGTIVILVNDRSDGGLRTGAACSVGQDYIVKAKSAGRTFLHEVGHSMGLGDEYVLDDPRYQEIPPCFNCCSDCNAGNDPCRKCEAWDNVSGACCYEGCNYKATGSFRSAKNCVMRDGAEFCPACTHHLRSVLEKLSVPSGGLAVLQQVQWDSPSRVYWLQLRVTREDGQLVLEQLGVIEGFGDADVAEGTFSYEVLGAAGELLYSARFRDPRRLQVFLVPPSLPDGEDEVVAYSFDPRGDVRFGLLIPYFWNGHNITVRDDQGKVILQVDISEFVGGMVRGTIRDHSGVGVGGAWVYARGPEFGSTRSDDVGAYELALAPGRYDMHVMAEDPNLLSSLAVVDVARGQVSTFDVVLGAAGSIGGQVSDSAGKPVTTAWVYPDVWEPPYYHVDDDGNYIIPGLVAGQYSIVIDCPGYGEWYIYVNGQYVKRGTSVQVTVELGKTTRVDFSQRAPGAFWDFEAYSTQAVAEAAGWTFGGLWRLVTQDQVKGFSPNPTPFPSPVRAVYFGNTQGNYATVGTKGAEIAPASVELRMLQAGTKSYGELTSPQVSVAGMSWVEVSFRYFRVVEYYPTGSFDRTIAQVRFDDGAWQQVWMADSKVVSAKEWLGVGPIAVQVPSGASTMRLRFVFDSIDHYHNNFLGWLVDDVRIASSGQGTASFTYSALAVSPTTGRMPLKITASATVANTGTVQGTEKVRLLVNGTERATRDVTLAAKASATVTFETTLDQAGSHSVTIGGLAPIVVQVSGNEIHEQRFEGGLAGWTADGLWRLASGTACFSCGVLSGTYAFYAVAAGCNYNTGARTSGRLTSPVINLQGAQYVQVRFDQFRHVEEYTKLAFDRATLEVNFGPAWIPVWTRTSQQPSPECTAVTVGPFAVPAGAATIQLRFVFDSVDTWFNGFPGWAVDNVVVTRAASGQPLSTLAVAPDAPRAAAEVISVFNIPNPVRNVRTTRFVVRGVEPEVMRVEVYDLAGRLVYRAEGPGSELVWHTQDLTGLPLANGVYLYTVQTRVAGQWLSVGPQKLVILR